MRAAVDALSIDDILAMQPHALPPLPAALHPQPPHGQQPPYPPATGAVPVTGPAGGDQWTGPGQSGASGAWAVPSVWASLTGPSLEHALALATIREEGEETGSLSGLSLSSSLVLSPGALTRSAAAAAAGAPTAATAAAESPRGVDGSRRGGVLGEGASSLDSDDFQAIMGRLLTDITRSLAAVTEPLEGSPGGGGGAAAAAAPQEAAARAARQGAAAAAGPQGSGSSGGSGSSNALTASSAPVSSLSSGAG
jgi:hypothetical protein